MSDDWGRYRPELGDEDEKDEADVGREDPGGWPKDEPDAGKEAQSGWPDDEPEPGEESASGWPTAGSTWQRSEYGGTPSEWQRSDESEHGSYGYRQPEELSEEAGADRYAAHRSRDPLARLFPGLPRSVRVTLDWILTIAGAILIVLALKEWVVNPYRIPSSSMEPTLNCAKGPANPGCLGDSSDRVLACRICLDFGPPSRGDIVVFNTPDAAVGKCGEGGTFVKRVIGLPGEIVHEDEKGFILVKQPGSPEFVKLKEPYLTAQRRLADSAHFGQTWNVPQDEYFMMGDNRSESCDSRTWGAVPRNKLIGIVFFVYWPPDRISFR
jgi:signal peptidase I